MNIEYNLYPRVLTEEELNLLHICLKCDKNNNGQLLYIARLKDTTVPDIVKKLEDLDNKLTMNCCFLNLHPYIKNAFRQIYGKTDELVKKYQADNGIIGSTDEEVKAVFDWLFNKIEEA